MSTPDNEYRSAPVENRSTETYHRIGGLGVPYGKRSRLLPGGFYEVVENRALAKTLADKANVVSRLEHHPEWLLGSTDAGTMRLLDDPKVGLDYEVDLPDTTAGNDTYVLTKRGDLKSASMAFQAYEQEFRHEGSILVRHLISIRLAEISPVSIPAYVETATALRHLAVQVGEDPDDVFELARQHELRSLFERTDLAVSAPPTVAPGDVARSNEPVEARSNASGDLDIRRRQLLLRKRQMDAELTPRQRAVQDYREQTADITTRLAGLRLREHELVNGVESRSVEESVAGKDLRGWSPYHY